MLKKLVTDEFSNVKKALNEIDFRKAMTRLTDINPSLVRIGKLCKKLVDIGNVKNAASSSDDDDKPPSRARGKAKRQKTSA